jgi:putative membrane protein
MLHQLFINDQIPFRRNRLLQGLIISYVLFWVWMSIEPYNSFGWWLENLLIFAAGVTLLVTYRGFHFTNLSYLQIVLFLALHTFGAHYSYNTNPVDKLIHSLFEFPRDEYDRVVHFCYGLLMAYPIRELITRLMKPSGSWAYYLTPALVLGSGAFYELIEMWTAFIVAPDIGTLFLGTQGDPWDAQHDMAVALYGSIIAMIVTAVVKVMTNKPAVARQPKEQRRTEAH